MADPAAERLAAELAWAASGAMRELEDLRAQLKMREAENRERADVIAELERHADIQRRAADDRAALIERLHAEFTTERDAHREARALITTDRDAALLAVEEQHRVASEARRDIAHLNDRIEVLTAACDERLSTIARISEQLRHEQTAHAITRAKLTLASADSTLYRTIKRLRRAKRSD